MAGMNTMFVQTCSASELPATLTKEAAMVWALASEALPGHIALVLGWSREQVYEMLGVLQQRHLLKATLASYCLLSEQPPAARAAVVYRNYHPSLGTQVLDGFFAALAWVEHMTFLPFERAWRKREKEHKRQMALQARKAALLKPRYLHNQATQPVTALSA